MRIFIILWITLWYVVFSSTAGSESTLPDALFPAVALSTRVENVQPRTSTTYRQSVEAQQSTVQELAKDVGAFRSIIVASCWFSYWALFW
jgi:hypothetical protein